MNYPEYFHIFYLEIYKTFYFMKESYQIQINMICLLKEIQLVILIALFHV